MILPMHQEISDNGEGISVVMLGATGAVGGHVARYLAKSNNVRQLTLLGRREVPGLEADNIQQHKIDIFDHSSYLGLLKEHEIAICTLGVGDPSAISKEEFLRIDKQAVGDFARACKISGVQHFELLSSIGAGTQSPSFYLRSKGELEQSLEALEFERLSLFHPSMILTPTNRYGLSQAIVLKLWPRLSPVLRGRFRKYRGIEVDRLGTAMALNVFERKANQEVLHWDDVMELISR